MWYTERTVLYLATAVSCTQSTEVMTSFAEVADSAPKERFFAAHEALPGNVLVTMLRTVVLAATDHFDCACLAL